jgi:hypothetical protein
MCAFLQVASLANTGMDEQQNSAQPVNAVIEWNRTLLAIVRTPGAQPATIHSTRSFAILHAAIYDAVNNIEPRFSPYLVRLPGVPRSASKTAAADEAAHDVLVFLYPAFQVSFDTELQQDFALLPR